MPSQAHLEPGTLVDRFQVRRLLGSGGMGQVYLATDTVLGRQVALKVLRTGSASAKQAQRLLEEARATALFNHPNIIHIYHAGIYGGEPYLALEYVAGESLADRLKQKRFSPMEAVRIGHALASALAESHAAGILHRDLKPGNVMIGTDGRVRVLDFGMALAVTDGSVNDLGSGTSSPEPWLFGGTPAYMAPELWMAQMPTEATDVWALGVVLAELTTGRHPIRQSEEPLADRVEKLRPHDIQFDVQVPESVAKLIRDCLSPDPLKRPSARDAEHTLGALLAKPKMASPEQSPFRGLSAFGERHAHLFFGRDNEITSFVEHLRDHVVVPVVGASGAGKSSLVFAGVLPRLLEQDSWRFIRLRPGEFPLQTLARGLVSDRLEPTGGDESDSGPRERAEAHIVEAGTTTPQDAAHVVDRLRAAPEMLGLWLQQAAELRRGPVALVVDGLEEVFTTGPEDEDRRVFLEALCSVAPDPSLSYRVILTLREDFLGRFAAVAAAKHVLANMIVVTTPDANELEKAVRAPIEALAYRFDDPGLPREMVQQIKDEPNALPLLQYAAHQLWEKRDTERKLLLKRVYEDLGGVAGALAKNADGVVASFLPAEFDVAKAVLLRLVTARGTRANLPMERVVDGLGSAADRVVAKLVEARLLSLRRSQDRDGGVRVELAHEALIQAWRTLAGWIAECREGLHTLAELTTAAQLWDGRGRPPELLWTGKGLSDLVAKLPQSDLKVPPLTQRFLEASQSRHKRRQRIRRIGLGAAVALLLGMTVASSLIAALINEQKTEAQRQRDEAERQREIVLEQSLRIDKAQRNLGQFRLILMPFDWDPITQRKTAVDAGTLPALSWTLYDPTPTDPTEPGAPIANDRIAVRAEASGPVRKDWVETAAGPRILRVDGRGRMGEACLPAWISLRWLPGYAESEDAEIEEIVVPFPTCAATAAGMVEVPGGPGWSRLVHPDESADHPTGAEFLKREIPTFWFDKTETTIGSYAVFAELEENTGYGLPKLPKIDEYRGADGPDYPVSFVDWEQARAFCRYWGKELPTEIQWEKAARGGWTLDVAQTVVNPLPKRRFPWGDDPVTGRANLAGTEDGHRVHASVFSFADVSGPYGTLNQTGNVSEWVQSTVLNTDSRDLRLLVGGDWATDQHRPWPEIGQINTRHPRALNYTTGFRCAVSHDGLAGR